MKKSFLFVLLSVLAIFSFGQDNIDLSVSNNQTISTSSASIILGDYTAPETLTVTICSSDPINTHISIILNEGYNFPFGTSLCVYDGGSTEDALLVCINSTYPPLPEVSFYATETNPSGCLTLVFTGSVPGASFTASCSSRFLCLPRSVDIISASPELQAGQFVNVCWNEENGESDGVRLIAQGTYPDVGYTLYDPSVWFTWLANGQVVAEGQGLTEFLYSFSDRQGYNVAVFTRDSHDCISTQSETVKIRISQEPTLILTTTNQSIMCLGDIIEFCTVYNSSFAYGGYSEEMHPEDTDVLALPDTPPLCFESSIVVDCFLPDQIIENANDLNSICMKLAHTFIGDLTMYLICPNGSQVQIETQGGGGCNLGVPPNTGYWYCITESANETMAIAGSGNSSLESGDYAPYQSFSQLEGCPLNGNWTLKICDNWSMDAGTCFGWNLNFNPDFFPNTWTYTNNYTTNGWTGNYGVQIDEPSNTDCASGTYLTSENPDVDSEQVFTVLLSDDFGCEYQHSASLTLLNQNHQYCLTSVPEITDLSDYIYPNPFTDIIYVQKVESIKIYDSSSKLVLQVNGICENEAIDLTKLTSGTYFIEGNFENETQIFKIIKL